MILSVPIQKAHMRSNGTKVSTQSWVSECVCVLCVYMHVVLKSEDAYDKIYKWSFFVPDV